MIISKNQLSNYLFCISFFFSLFPHTTFGFLNIRDTQISLIFPFFFMIFFIFSINRFKFNYLILFIGFIFLLALTINLHFTSKIYFSTLSRTIINYFFFLIFLLCFYTFYETNEKRIKKNYFFS